MSGSLEIFWDPEGIELDSLGSKRYLRATDGDTPYVSMNVRLLSMDAPETHYPGNAKPSRQDEKLAQLAEWIREGRAPVEPGLGEYLCPKLAGGNAGSLQEEQGRKAAAYFRKLTEERLTDGGRRHRPVYLRTADRPFDRYGRLLAYVAPQYTAEERARMSRRERATFNLLMVEAGWAAPFPIFPSLPGHADLILLREAAERAFVEERGAWAEPAALAGYEFRMCVRLYEVARRLAQGRRLGAAERSGWVRRYCVDMTTREIYYPQDYYLVPIYNRLFVWPEDVKEAVAALNLVPARRPSG